VISLETAVDVHRRTLAADGAAAQKAGGRQNDPPDNNHWFEERLALRTGVRAKGENRLRNAAAFSPAKIARRQPGDDEEACRRQQPRPKSAITDEAPQRGLGDIGKLRKGHGGHTHRGRRAPQQQAGLPMRQRPEIFDAHAAQYTVLKRRSLPR
jgi:hypothetical protein